MFLSSEIIEGLKGKYKQSTIESYSKDIKRVYKEALDLKVFNPSYLLCPEPIKNWLNNLKQDPNREEYTFKKEHRMKHYLAVIIAVYKAHSTNSPNALKQYEDMFEAVSDRVREIDSSYVPATKEEKKNLIKKENLLEVRKHYDELVKDHPTKKDYILKRFIIICYTELPPLRNQDWVSCCYAETDEDKKQNHIDLDAKKMVIYKYKTDRGKNTPRVIDIPDLLVTEMRETKEKLGTKWVVPKQSDMNSPQSSSGFTHYMNNIFNYKYGAGGLREKSIGSAVLRRVHCSNLIDRNATAEERNEDARIMAHHSSTANKVYSKYSEVLHPEPKEEDNEIKLLIENIQPVSFARTQTEGTQTEASPLEEENARLKAELTEAKAMIRQLSLMVSQLSK